MSATMARLKKDHLTARKEKDVLATALLGTLIGEAAIVGKNAGNRESTEDEVLAVARKFLKNLEETKRLLGENGGSSDALAANAREIEIVKAYLPQMMSEDELKQAVAAIISEKPDAKMGDVMGALKAKYAGLYDGKLASAVTKAALGA